MGKAIIAFILSVGVGTWLSFFNHGIGVVVSISILCKQRCGLLTAKTKIKDI